VVVIDTRFNNQGGCVYVFYINRDLGQMMPMLREIVEKEFRFFCVQSVWMKEGPGTKVEILVPDCSYDGKMMLLAERIKSSFSHGLEIQLTKHSVADDWVY